MGSTESHQAGSEPTVKYDESVAAIVNDGSASKPSASLGARHTVDEPSNPAAVTDSRHQASDLIVSPAAVCPGVITHQSHQLFKDNTDQSAVPVWIEKAGLRYRIMSIKCSSCGTIDLFAVYIKFAIHHLKPLLSSILCVLLYRIYLTWCCLFVYRSA